VSDNGVIGRSGGLPWHLPADLSYFAALTAGHCLVMGRRTFESLRDDELPGRTIIVLSQDPGFTAPGVAVATSLAEALELGRRHEMVFVAGGTAVYEQGVAVADRLYLTRVHAEVEGDTLFPDVDLEPWRLVSRRHRTADAANRYDLTFEVWHRRAASGRVE
jgi:dihydrofolate reductase